MKTLHAIRTLGIVWLVLGLPAWGDARAPRKKTALDDYAARVDRPAAGWTAFFAELVFDSGDPRAPYKFTTQVHIVPDVLPHSFEDFHKTIK